MTSAVPSSNLLLVKFADSRTLAAMDRDHACIQSLLSQALEQESENLTADQKSSLLTLCEDATSMLFKLHNSRVESSSKSEQEEPSSCMDAEVLDLYQKVCLADARVKQLRDEVPLVLTEAIQKHLVACRPSALDAVEATFGISNTVGLFGSDDAAPCSDIGQTGDLEDADETSLPDLKAWQQLKEVSNRVPSVMARLDQTLQRLTRIIDITEADQNRPSPRTVEKALLNRSGGILATAMNDVEIGAATTRKRLAFGLGA